jgi:hypothetical protein
MNVSAHPQNKQQELSLFQVEKQNQRKHMKQLFQDPAYQAMKDSSH